MVLLGLVICAQAAHSMGEVTSPLPISCWPARVYRHMCELTQNVAGVVSVLSIAFDTLVRIPRLRSSVLPVSTPSSKKNVWPVTSYAVLSCAKSIYRQVGQGCNQCQLQGKRLPYKHTHCALFTGHDLTGHHRVVTHLKQHAVGAVDGDRPLEGMVDGAALDPRSRAITVHMKVDGVSTQAEGLSNPLQLHVTPLQARPGPATRSRHQHLCAKHARSRAAVSNQAHVSALASTHTAC